MIVADAAYSHQLGVAAGNQQGQEGERRFGLGQQRRQQVALQVVDAQHRNVQAEGQRVGHAGAHQQRAAQARALGVGDGVEVGQGLAGFGQAGLGQRNGAADVVAAGQLRHHAAVFGVHGHLGVQLVGQQAAVCVVQRDSGFVAGRFNT